MKGLIRQFFPKWTDFNKDCRREIKNARDMLSGRPGKTWNNLGAVTFPFELRRRGKCLMKYLIRERDKNYWRETSRISMETVDFTLTKRSGENGDQEA